MILHRRSISTSIKSTSAQPRRNAWSGRSPRRSQRSAFLAVAAGTIRCRESVPVATANQPPTTPRSFRCRPPRPLSRPSPRTSTSLHRRRQFARARSRRATGRKQRHLVSKWSRSRMNLLTSLRLKLWRCRATMGSSRSRCRAAECGSPTSATSLRKAPGSSSTMRARCSSRPSRAGRSSSVSTARSAEWSSHSVAPRRPPRRTRSSSGRLGCHHVESEAPQIITLRSPEQTGDVSAGLTVRAADWLAGTTPRHSLHLAATLS